MGRRHPAAPKATTKPSRQKPDRAPAAVGSPRATQQRMTLQPLASTPFQFPIGPSGAGNQATNAALAAPGWTPLTASEDPHLPSFGGRQDPDALEKSEDKNVLRFARGGAPATTRALMSWAMQQNKSTDWLAKNILGSNEFTGNEEARREAAATLTAALGQASLDDWRERRREEQRAHTEALRQQAAADARKAEKDRRRDWVHGGGSDDRSPLKQPGQPHADYRDGPVHFPTYDDEGELQTLTDADADVYGADLQRQAKRLVSDCGAVLDEFQLSYGLNRKNAEASMRDAAWYQKPGLAAVGMGDSKVATSEGVQASIRAARAMQAAKDAIATIGKNQGTLAARQLNEAKQLYFEARHLLGKRKRETEGHDEDRLSSLETTKTAGRYASMAVPGFGQLALSVGENAAVRISTMHSDPKASFGVGSFLRETAGDAVGAFLPGPLKGENAGITRKFLSNIAGAKTGEAISQGDPSAAFAITPSDLIMATVGTAHEHLTHAKPTAGHETAPNEADFSDVSAALNLDPPTARPATPKDAASKTAPPSPEIHELHEPSKAQGVGGEVHVPFALYSGEEWNHIGGGEETKSSRTSLARQTRYSKDPSAGFDYIVQNRKTGRLVIGEQKAVGKASFEKASAITTSLEKNLAHTIDTLKGSIREGKVHPDGVADLEHAVGQLEATLDAVKKRAPLPDGVVFELTNLGGGGKQVGRNHVKLLAEKYGDDPAFVEHLLDRTFIRAPELATAQGRPKVGARGTDADPEITPARDVLTDDAKDELARVRSGKSPKQWERQKQRERLAEERAAQKTKEERAARRKADQEARAAKKRADQDARAAERARLREERAAAKKNAAAAPKEKGRSRKASAGDTASKSPTPEAPAATTAPEAAAADVAPKQKQTSKPKRQRAATAAAETPVVDTPDTKAGPAKSRKVAKAKPSSADPPSPAAEEAQPTKRTPAKNGPPERNSTAPSRGEHVAGALGKADAALGAVRDYQQYRTDGQGEASALARAATTLVANMKGGPAAAMVNAANAYDNARRAGQGKAEAAATAIGTAGGGIIAGKVAPTGPAGAAVNLANTAAQALGAPQGVQDATAGAAAIVPSNIIGTTLAEGARSISNLGTALLSGDGKALDKQVQGYQAGAAGPWLQGYAQVTGMVADMAAGDSFEKALDKAAAPGRGSWADRVGSRAGDALYDLGQSTAAKAGKYGAAVQGISQSLGIASDMISGDSFEKALGKQSAPGTGGWTEKAGNAPGDAAWDATEKARQMVSHDLPTAKQLIKDKWNKLWN